MSMIFFFISFSLMLVIDIWMWPLMQNTDSEIGASSLGRTVIRWLLLPFWPNHVIYFKVWVAVQKEISEPRTALWKNFACEKTPPQRYTYWRALQGAMKDIYNMAANDRYPCNSCGVSHFILKRRKQKGSFSCLWFISVSKGVAAKVLCFFHVFLFWFFWITLSCIAYLMSP